MSSKPPLPSAVYHLVSKRGAADCAIASLAFLTRREYEEVLIAAAKVDPHVWRTGLHATDMVKVAKRLQVKAKWVASFDPEEEIGVLWVSYHDSTKEHIVVLMEGWVFDPEHNPVSVWRYDEFCSANNAYGNTLLKVVE